MVGPFPMYRDFRWALVEGSDGAGLGQNRTGLGRVGVGKGAKRVRTGTETVRRARIHGIIGETVRRANRQSGIVRAGLA